MNELKQIEEFKKAMDTAINDFFDNNNDDDIVDNFYNSSFEIVFNDRQTKTVHKIKLFICPEIWETMEELVKDLPETIEDYV